MPLGPYLEMTELTKHYLRIGIVIFSRYLYLYRHIQPVSVSVSSSSNVDNFANWQYVQNVPSCEYVFSTALICFFVVPLLVIIYDAHRLTGGEIT